MMTTITTPDCDAVRSRIDDLLEGGAGEAEAAVRAHLEACPACRDELEGRRRLAEAVSALPRSVAPERDLWPGIAARIEQRRVVRGVFGGRLGDPRRWATAAAAAAVLAVSVTAAYLVGAGRARVAVVEPPAPGPAAVQATYGGAADELERARDLLRAGLERRRDELSPETWAVVMDNMAVIDEAIARIETALADDPEDGRLNRQLALAYRRQIDLLQRASRLPSAA
ncbi:MAG: zf-HC2 domain-containing protein [Thermoanaerobaculales bacterium]|jgi:hypothetical protein|nr:zf-HC2 domain-containing protein [Thermoanaerobaculales bacterium]